MIEYADKDRDGRINFQEFLEVVTKEYPQIWSSKLPSMLQFHKTKEKAEPWMGINITIQYNKDGACRFHSDVYHLFLFFTCFS
jgi:hypothetical protein